MKKNLIIICSAVLMLILLTGCRIDSKDVGTFMKIKPLKYLKMYNPLDALKMGTTYRYSDSEICYDSDLVKSMYCKDELRLYISGLDENYSVVCYDKEFSKIDEAFETEYRHGVLRIKGEDVRKIEGITLEGNWRIQIRYLKSKQFAALAFSWADDLGWDLMHGDWDAYYTEEELAAQEERKEKARKEQEENWAVVEGMWTCPDDPRCYMNFFVDEQYGKAVEFVVSFDGDECMKDNIYVSTINLRPEYDDSGIMLELLDGDGWGCCYQFDLSNDYSELSAYGMTFVRGEASAVEAL